MNAFLANSSRIRFATMMLLYFAQGIPRGLLQIAMPAWMATQGLGAAAIASYLAIVMLPWVFKLLTGPVMDRFKFPAMGMRRPWVLAAQFGTAASLCLLTLVTHPMEQLSLLTAIAVVVNVFTATQDVAVDGMAIDLVPESEQGRINAFMTFGKTIGWAGSAALSAALLTAGGLGLTGIIAALVSFGVFTAFLVIREREGERVLPWTAGASGSGAPAAPNVASVARNLRGVLWSRTSAFVFMTLFAFGLGGGYADALLPIAAVNQFGFSTEQWSELVASIGLLGAFVALATGPVLDRYEVKRTSMFAVGAMAIHASCFALTSAHWENATYVRGMMTLWVLMEPAVGVSMIVIAMNACSRAISATQFAVYMAATNLGVCGGSTIYAAVSERISVAESYMVLAAILGLNIAVLMAFRRQDDTVGVTTT